MGLPMNHGLASPPRSTVSPAASTASLRNRPTTLPKQRSRPLHPRSQDRIALIHYLDDRILRITRRYAKKFSDEGLEYDDTPGYTTYDAFVADADPLLDVVWASGTPTLQVPYLLNLAGLVCSYLQAFPFSVSLFYIAAKIDQAFASLLQPVEDDDTSGRAYYRLSVTEKVRIKSLIEETRVVAVRAASTSGHIASVHDISGSDDDDDDDDGEEEDELNDDVDESSDDPTEALSVSFGLARIYNKTMEILGDSLASNALPQN